MKLIQSADVKPIKLQLSKNLVRSIKRGHPWVYTDSLRDLPKSNPGALAILLDNRGGKEIARGFYDSSGPIALRICTTQPGVSIDNAWAASSMQRALDLRQSHFNADTTAYRLFNGEGDGLPGLVCDRYEDTAVIVIDGSAARHFWHTPGIARWLADNLNLNRVYERYQDRTNSVGKAHIGSDPVDPIHFLENGYHFTAGILRGQKTGFFLDQRDNRMRMAKYCANKRVLNLFGYTGGFSIYTGASGATHVTTVDSAQAALETASHHWQLNNLPDDRHLVIRADAFAFMETARRDARVWDCVIIDPPSFAHSQASLPKALAAYKKLVASGTSLTDNYGFLAVSSCSSHVDMADFIAICQEGVSMARRKATILGIYTQPADHPTPLAMPEFRYLKFLIFRIQ